MYRKQSHEGLVNRFLEDSLHFIVEDMSYKTLQKKDKRTEFQEKVSDMVQKDGTMKRTHKYKRKKRFGKSSNNWSWRCFNLSGEKSPDARRSVCKSGYQVPQSKPV